jgi:hypothetical protein
MSFPTNPANGQTTVVNGITYIYNQTNNAWKRQTLTDITTSGNITATTVTTATGVNFADGSRITSGLVYDLDAIRPDGRTSLFRLTYNQNTVTVANPWNLLVTINGIFQPAYTENTDLVWLSHAVFADVGYTISAGNLKFSESPPAGTTVYARTQPGSSQPTPKIYPFKPVDIALGM